MSETTAIEWCDSTFNPWIGCTQVSPACDDCYAARSAPARTLGVAWGPRQARMRTSEANWAQPRRWNARADQFIAEHGRRQRVFCASLADVFDNEVPVQWRISLMSLILETPNLDWLLLTKRIGNAAEMLETATRGYTAQREGWRDNVPPNVWIGATICNQDEADRDIPKLLATPAAVRFLSVEPMLGPIELPRFCACGCQLPWGHAVREAMKGPSALNRDQAEAYVPSTLGVDWVICGGESGHKARPMHPAWARGLRDQCAAAGVPFLFKQWGEWLPAREARSITGPVLVLEGSAPFTDRPRWHAFEDGQQSAYIGKKAAGRRLDGVEHLSIPASGGVLR
ncbi:phage Gp37/Gp68 family protein [Paucibacter sp. B51]|uniref:phage Gp37/Gp68 family protein n=1 Tax=Paucibacter sp. B51 TaxID=2993315 RepID=UPI0022EBF218|nr:phage Gp37/Gp68 family protein [Paucibacter sp. B51]